MMILTDDDTRAFGPESCFGGPDDRDPMYDDAPDGLLKCDRGNGPCCLDDEGKYVGPGCCHASRLSSSDRSRAAVYSVCRSR